MTDPDGATCPRCGAPIPAGNPAGLCPRCLLANTQGGHNENPPVSPSSPEGARRETFPAEAGARIGAILLGLLLGAGHVQEPADLLRLWFANMREQQAVAEAHFNLGNALRDEGN